MTKPSRRPRPRKLARALVCAVAAGVMLSGVVGLLPACTPPPQRKPVEMVPIGTVMAVERTASDGDGGTTTPAPSSGPLVSAKDAACTMADVDSLQEALRGCDAPVPKNADVPTGLADKLDVSVTTSAASTTPGGHLDVTLTMKNRTADPVPLYFAGEGHPRFEVELFDAKGGKRIDVPLGKVPKAAIPPVRPVKASRITLLPGGSVRIRVPWDAVKTRWAPEKVKTWDGRGPARATYADLPYGRYQLRVALPLLTAEKGDLDTPKIGVEIAK